MHPTDVDPSMISVLKHTSSDCLATLVPARQCNHQAAIAQLGERQTEDLKVPGSIPGLGIAALQLQANLIVGEHALASSQAEVAETRDDVANMHLACQERICISSSTKRHLWDSNPRGETPSA